MDSNTCQGSFVHEQEDHEASEFNSHMALKAKGLQLLREELRLRTDLVCEPRLPDYELTSLSIWGKRSRNSTLFRGFIEGLNRYRGETIQEKAEALFREAGMTDEQFEKLRQMLTE